jgi:hypothetical protein
LEIAVTLSNQYDRRQVESNAGMGSVCNRGRGRCEVAEMDADDGAVAQKGSKGQPAAPGLRIAPSGGEANEESVGYRGLTMVGPNGEPLPGNPMTGEVYTMVGTAAVVGATVVAAPAVLEAWGARMLARESLAAKVVNPSPSVINEIKALADGARLTSRQVSELGKNIDAVLTKTLPAKFQRGRVDDVVNLFKTDLRFRFIDQVPGARQRIVEALGKFGASLE